MSSISLLRRSGLFVEFNDEELKAIVEISKEHRLSAGEPIIQEGSRASSLYFVEIGSVDVLKNRADARIPCLSHLMEGDLFGELAFLEGAPRAADVVAHDGLTVLELHYQDIEKLVNENPKLGVKFYRALSLSISKKLRKTTEDLLNLILSSRLVALGQMAMSIGHEINNLLSIILFNLERIEGAMKDEVIDRPSILQEITTGRVVLDRITKIVAGIKMAGRDSRNDPMVPTNLRTLITETLTFCQQRYKNSDIRLEIPAVPDDIYIKCRSVEISQVLINLLNNSYDAIKNLNDRWVKLEFNDFGDRIQISITDSGPKIPKEIRERMFHPFFTTKCAGQGTGLGLSISRKIVEAHGGCLDISGASQNPRFEINLPKEGRT